MSASLLLRRSFIVLSLLVGSAAALHAQSATQTPAQASAQATAQANGQASAPAALELARDQRRVTYTVAARALARGDTLRAEDIAVLDTVITWRWNSAPDTTRAVPGWVARRAIAAGEVLRAPAVAAPPVISSGQTVTAIWQDGSLRLAIAGVATNAAALGAPVGVRIGRSRRLDGVAVGPNTVRLR